MSHRSLQFGLVCLLATGMLMAAPVARAQPAAAITDYQAKLAQYQVARGAYEAEASAYWDAVAEKRRARNTKRREHLPIGLDDYVVTQPPVYSGPARPIDPHAPAQPPPERPEIPVVADFLKNAAEKFGFVPDRPASDVDFKRAYAKAALAAGLTRDQIVGVYVFETGGNGSYDSQAGLVPYRPGARAISPAVGYNQLLSTNTVSLFAEDGNRAQNRGPQTHDRLQPFSPKPLERARPPGQNNIGRIWYPRGCAGYRSRPPVTGAKADGLGPICARQGSCGATDCRRARVDESD